MLHQCKVGIKLHGNNKTKVNVPGKFITQACKLIGNLKMLIRKIRGKLKILDMGDLTKDKEAELVCPRNKVGQVDIYVVSHHGWYQSNSPAFLSGIAPRVAIMDNGAKKGGTPSAWDIIEKSPRLEDLWQLHFSEEGGAAHNVATEFIANPQGADGGNDLELTAWPSGNFEVLNSRTEKTKKYSSR